MTLATKEWVINLLNKALGMGGNPTGTIINYMGNNAPKGYLACDGAEYNIADYQKFADYLKREFGSINYFGGDGITSFKVPDLRGEFLRGTGANSHTSQGSGDGVGVHQDATTHLYAQGGSSSNQFLLWRDTTKSTAWNQILENFDSTVQKSSGQNYITLTASSVQGAGASTYTSRPTNTSVLYCIKY